MKRKTAYGGIDHRSLNIPVSKRTSSVLAACLLATAMLAGCASTNGLNTSAVSRDANSLQSTASMAQAVLSDAAWPTEEWWRRYEDTQLNELIAEALEKSPNLHVAQARVRQAAALTGISEAASGPQVSLNAKSTRQLFSEDGTTPPPVAGQWKWVNESALNLAYDFDFWGKNRSAIEVSLGRARAAEVDAYAARLALVTGILQSYVNLQQAFEQLDIAEASLKQREQVFALTQERVAAKIDSLVDLKQAQSLVPAAKGRIAQVNEGIAVIRAQLAALTGGGPDRGLALSRPDLHEVPGMMVPSNVPAELIGRRPDVVAQRWRAEAAGKDIQVARAQFYPNISLTALVGLQSLGFSNFLYAGSRITGIGPALTLPVFDSGRLRSNLAARNAEYDIAVEQYNATVVDAVRDVVSQLLAMRWLEEQRTQQRDALKTATEAYELALERYRVGVGNYLQVLTAQGQVLASRRQLADLDMRAIGLDIDLARALGGGFRQQS